MEIGLGHRLTVRLGVVDGTDGLGMERIAHEGTSLFLAARALATRAQWSLTGFSQEDIAEMLEVTQGYISKLERQDDMLLSRLYAFVEALGGDVEIRVKFPGNEVRITQFSEVEKLEATLAQKAKKRTA